MGFNSGFKGLIWGWIGQMLEGPHEYVSHLCTNCSVYCVISGFRREVDENCALLGHYAASSGSYVPTFRDNLSVTSSRAFLDS